MALADSYCVLAELARAGRALEPSDLALRLDWRIDRACAALHALTAIRPMPVGVDAYGQYFITLPGRRRLRPHVERDIDDDDDDGDEPNDAVSSGSRHSPRRQRTPSALSRFRPRRRSSALSVFLFRST